MINGNNIVTIHSRLEWIGMYSVILRCSVIYCCILVNYIISTLVIVVLMKSLFLVRHLTCIPQ